MDIVQYLLSFALVIGLLLALLYGLKQWQRSHLFVRGTQRLQIIETLSVAPRQKIMLVRCDQREWLVGVSPTHMHTLGDVSATQAPVDMAFTDTPPSS